MEIVINNVVPEPTIVTVTYLVPTDLDAFSNPSSYTVQLPFTDAPNQDDLTSTDNYSYYQNLILGK